MNKRDLILIGDWPEHVITDLGLFDAIKKEFKTDIKKINDFEYETIIHNKKILFQFCFGSENSTFREKRENHLGKKIPPSIQTIAETENTVERVYYFGFCGLLNGEINTIYLPTAFQKISFKEYFISENTAFSLSKQITFKNSLSGKIPGVACTGLTSNQVLMVNYIKDKNPETLKRLGEKLSDKANIVEMEGFGVAKYFGSTHPIGLAYLGTDAPAQTLGKVKVNWNIFTEMILRILHK